MHHTLETRSDERSCTPGVTAQSAGAPSPVSPRHVDRLAARRSRPIDQRQRSGDPRRAVARTTVCWDERPLEEHLAADLDDAFPRLLVAYQDRLFGFALRLTTGRQDAEEVVQDAFVRAYRALMSYPTDRIHALHVTPWLFQITLNVARNRARGSRLATVSLQVEQEASNWEPEDDAAAGPEPLALQREMARDLSAAVAALPQKYRVAVSLRHGEGLTYPELAVALGQPIGTMKATVHRGVRLLSATLKSTERNI